MFQSSHQYNNGPDYLYYDLTCTNHDMSAKNFNLQLVYRDIRQNTMIEKLEDYLLSIVHFQLDTSSIPVHRFEIQPNQNDANLSIYSITLEYDGVNPVTVTQPEYLYWIPVNQDISVPPAPSLNANSLQTDSKYYYSYSYEHMIRLTNTALSEAMIKLSWL